MSTLSLTTLLLTLSAIILREQNRYDRLSSRKEWDTSYDFIVVGAGSAGSVVASRLAIANFKVLLLEYGAQETIVSTMPSMSDTLKNTRMDWNYTIVPQKYSSFGLSNRTMQWPRGRVLGGTSAINRMVSLVNCLLYSNYLLNDSSLEKCEPILW